MTPPLLHLNNNFTIPSIGMGTGRKMRLKGASGVLAIKEAIDAGYRLFDTAFLYDNEDIVGQAISEKIAEGAVKRHEIIIIGKLWGIHHDQVERACRDSCKRLNVDYIDLYLIHFPVSFRYKSDEEKWPLPEDCLNKDYLDVWSEMEKLVDVGLVKHIGLSNFNAQQIQRVYELSTIKPACIETEFNVAFACDELIKLCKDLSIQPIAFCPLGRPKPEKLEPKFLYDGKVIDIAIKYHKSPAQIALRYSIQCGLIPIPKTSTKNRIYENMNVFDFQLSDNEMDFLKTFHNDGNRICKFHFADGNVHYPF